MSGGSWYSTLVTPGWEHFPPATRFAWIDEPGDAVFVMRTGALETSHRVGQRIKYGTPLSVAERGWRLVASLHWFRLAHARGGYA